MTTPATPASRAIGALNLVGACSPADLQAMILQLTHIASNLSALRYNMDGVIEGLDSAHVAIGEMEEITPDVTHELCDRCGGHGANRYGVKCLVCCGSGDA